MPSETYTSNGVFPLSGTGLSDYTITQIVIAGGGGGVGVKCLMVLTILENNDCNK
jgi:hypothetical protein